MVVDFNNTAKDITLLNKVVVEIDAFCIKVEDSLLLNVGEVVSAITSLMNDNAFTNPFEKLDELSIAKWKEIEIPEHLKPTFISSIILSPIELELTFQAKPKGDDMNEDLVVITSIFQGLGVALSNVDEAPIKISGIKLDNCFDSVDGIKNKIIQHIKREAITQVFKLLGSLSVIGNPVALFSNISTGFQDLYDKPKEGFVKGPLEAGKGIALGAGSLLTHTVAGALNSLNKITGSLGSGLSALTMD